MRQEFFKCVMCQCLRQRKLRGTNNEGAGTQSSNLNSFETPLSTTSSSRVDYSDVMEPHKLHNRVGRKRLFKFKNYAAITEPSQLELRVKEKRKKKV